MVEAVGIEAGSGSARTYRSTCIAFLLGFASLGLERYCCYGRLLGGFNEAFTAYGYLWSYTLE